MYRRRKTPFILSFVIGLVVIVIFAFQLFAKSGSFSSFLLQFALNKNIQLKKNDDHINILLLGRRGGGMLDGPNLTDTIILANIDEAKNKVTLVSIPRDLWMPDLEGTNKKINGAYQEGEDVKKGGGIPLTKAAIKKVTGQDVDYAVVIDFSGFVKAVDVLGGLDINVANTFDDYNYPIGGKEDDTCGNTSEDIQAFVATDSAEADIEQKFSCRYMHLHFDKGPQHMDGETALEFVRSRHAAGVEGSDFARSQRQEKVISAFRDKLLSAQTFINPAKMISLYTVLESSIDTDIKSNELDDFVKLAQKMRQAKIQSAVIDAGDITTQRPGLLETAPLSVQYDNLFVLIPRVGNGNFSEIQKYISCEISKGVCPISKAPNK